MTTTTPAEALDATRLLVAMSRAWLAADFEGFDTLARGIADPELVISAAVALLALTARDIAPLLGQTADDLLDAMGGLR